MSLVCSFPVRSVNNLLGTMITGLVFLREQMASYVSEFRTVEVGFRPLVVLLVSGSGGEIGIILWLFLVLVSCLLGGMAGVVIISLVDTGMRDSLNFWSFIGW